MGSVSEGTTMTEVEEEYELVAGRSLIDVRGGGFDSVLLVGGRLIVLNWCNCAGSVEQYLARAGRADCESELRTLRYALEGNWSCEAPISSRIFPFLELFVPGRYRLRPVVSCPDCEYIEFDSSWEFARGHEEFYPFGRVLVFTQSTDALDRGRVGHYREVIRRGRRPIALTATVEDGWCEFVVDGHHKLQAYKAEGVRPTFVSVSRLGAPRLTPASFDAHIGRGHPLSAHYRDVKARYDAETGPLE
jgi:hypothetical protein